MIKDILTLLDLSGDMPAAPVALDLAQQTGAHITGLAPIIEPALPGYVAGPIPTEVLDHARDQAVGAAEAARDAFKEKAERMGIPVESRIVSMTTSGGTHAFTNHCRMTDLVIIGQDNPDKPQVMRTALIEAALFDGSAPMLLVPYVNHGGFTAKKVMVAWDGSRTAARAVHAALPVLAMADTIDLVIAGNPSALAGEPGADIALYLARHGLNVEIRRVPRGTTGVADSLLNYVSDNGVDLVVMGGYGHSRMREFVLGGATRGILEAMTAPVLMAH